MHVYGIICADILIIHTLTHTPTHALTVLRALRAITQYLHTNSVFLFFLPGDSSGSPIVL